MAADTHVAMGYNVQVAVDAKHKLIVEQQVTNQVVDTGLLTETAEPAKAILGIETIAVVADRGFSRQRTSKPARRGRDGEKASFARTSSSTTARRTAWSVLPGSVFSHTHHLCCAD